MADNEAGLRIDTRSNAPAPTPPSIAAAFLVNFDHRKGYVLGWHREIEGIQLEGDVELKSLPSGLHNVEEDLVYFVRDDYVGISAYINKPDQQSARNVNMLSVGVLLPLHEGRMGKSWLHAEGLKVVAKKMIKNVSDTSSLEEYWDQHQIQPSHARALPDESTEDLFMSKKDSHAHTNGYQKFRSMSAGSGFTPSMHTLAAHHPATTLLDFLDRTGPLIFPLYRAAVLRKRLLIITEAPVEFACNIVYNLSILASLPRSTLSLLPPSTGPSSLRRKPLFTVGVGDIPLLSLPSAHGWIACTTDDVLATKPECFDVLVFLPSADSRRARHKAYPKIVLSSPDLSKNFPRHGIKATQRDAERYTILREGLRAYPASIVEQPIVEEADPGAPSDAAIVADNNDAASTLSTTSTVQERKDIVEPASWSQVAYTSLLWWASAGDTRAGLSEAEQSEQEMDLALLDSGGADDDDDDDDGRTKEIVVVAYFRRLTGLLFDATARIVRGAAEGDYKDDEEEDAAAAADATAEENGMDGNGEAEDEGQQNGNSDQRRLLLPDHSGPDSDSDPIRVLDISSEDMSAMGLDMWSASDKQFIHDFLHVWWGRKAKIRGMGVECCGVKIM